MINKKNRPNRLLKKLDHFFLEKSSTRNLGKAQKEYDLRNVKIFLLKNRPIKNVNTTGHIINYKYEINKKPQKSIFFKNKFNIYFIILFKTYFSKKKVQHLFFFEKKITKNSGKSKKEYDLRKNIFSDIFPIFPDIFQIFPKSFFLGKKLEIDQKGYCSPQMVSKNYSLQSYNISNS